MTLDELKAEADKLGYRLTKKTQNEKFLPCICGCNKRDTWHSISEEWRVKLVCRKCGLSVTGKNEKDAKRNWNDYMRGNK